MPPWAERRRSNLPPAPDKGHSPASRSPALAGIQARPRLSCAPWYGDPSRPESSDLLSSISDGGKAKDRDADLNLLAGNVDRLNFGYAGISRTKQYCLRAARKRRIARGSLEHTARRTRCSLECRHRIMDAASAATR